MIEYKFTPLQERWRDIFRKNLWLTAKYLCSFNEESVKSGALAYPMYPYLHGRFLRMVQHNPWKNIATFMPRGYFKCLEPLQMLTLQNGNKITAKDITVGTKILSWNGNNFVFKSVIAKQWNPPNKIISFKLRSGQKLKVTPNHPVMTINGWKDAGELRMGDRIMAWAGSIMDNGGKQNSDVAWLLGLFVGDGCCLKCNRGSCKSELSMTNKDIISNVERICLKFGFDIRKGRKGTFYLTNGIKKVLRKYDIAGRGSWTKEVPDKIFDMDLQFRRAFIGGYFSADGSWTRLGKGYICTVSKKLAYSISNLLKTIGCFSTIKYYEYPKSKFSSKFYRIDIVDPISIKNLHKCEIYKQTGKGFIPSQDGFWRSVPKKWRKDGIPYQSRKKGIRIDNNYDTSYTKFRKFSKEINKEWACTDEVVWDEVLEIKKSISESIDLEVKDTHTLVVNGIVTHNSSMWMSHKIWRITNNQNIRIMLGSTNMELGKKFLTQMKKIIKSPLFCALFPEIIPQLPPNHPDSNWSRTSFTVNRTDDCTYGEPTVMIVTPGTNTEGLHFDDLWGNDLVNRKNYKSELQREETKEFVGNFANLQDSEDTPNEIEGTFWHPDDLYVADILNNPEYTIFYLPLYDNNGNVTFPEKFTPEYIESQRRKLGDKLFTTQMLLNPISEQEAFMSQYPFVRYNEENGKRITTDGRVFDAPIIGRMVPMDTAGRGKNLAAVGVIDLDNDGYFFVRYVKLRDRWKPSERLEEFKRIDKWFNPTKFGVELESQLMWDSILPEDFVEGKSNLRLKMVRLTTKGEKKKFRIRNIEPVLARERIFWHVGIGEKAIKEVQFYPEMMDDAVPDIISYGLSMFPMFHIYPAKQDNVPMSYWEPQHPEMFTFGQQMDEILQKHIEDNKYEEITKDDYRFDKK